MSVRHSLIDVKLGDVGLLTLLMSSCQKSIIEPMGNNELSRLTIDIQRTINPEDIVFPIVVIPNLSSDI